MQTITFDDTLYQLVPKQLPFETEMRPVIARMCRKVEGGACILFDDFWSELLSAAPTPPAQLEAVRVPLTDYKALYHELLFAVGMKHPDETRHQTALRYIRRAEAAHGITAAAPKEQS